MAEIIDGSYDESSLSPWWVRSIFIVMAFGFAVLILLTVLAYRNAPPVPQSVRTETGQVLFTGDEVRAGQTAFLKYGLMDNGSIWGHGAYLGPDYAANYLHATGETSARTLARKLYGRDFTALTVEERAAVRSRVKVLLKANRYDPATGVLTYTPAEAAAFEQAVGDWTAYFGHPATNGGLQPDLITDPGELRQLTAFFAWTAWASVANRPGEAYSYTNNFPFDPDVGNTPTGGALLWSALSLIALLAGIAVVLLAFGKFDYLGWTNRDHHVHTRLLPTVTPSQQATVKFFVIVTLLFLMQTLVGGATAHYRVDPGSFYGIPLADIFPSNLMRTWHLQTAIFWIATAYVAAALFLARILGKSEPRHLTALVHLLFGAFLVVIAGSLLGEWLGMSQRLGKLWFWLGDQGWEYLEIGRVWQALLVAGLLVWFALLFVTARPRNVADDARELSRAFLWASLAIPVFYIPAMFYGSITNYTVVDTWRFWIIHLWVEGFFEFFATTVVAVIFFRLGIATKITALRVIYLDAILYFLGGVIGTGHHWYFNGQSNVNMAFSAVFSALEVVPLMLLTLDAWDFIRLTRSPCTLCGEPISVPHKWTFYFLMAVGFWNFVGAGIFGFLVNLPIVSYYEVGTILTPNHAHTALMGVFGMLAVGLMIFVWRQTVSDKYWPEIEKYIRFAFWGLNIGLAMMVVLNLFPGGVLQVWDVTQHGYWHARSLAYTGGTVPHLLEWLRLPGDLVFIIFGAIPLVIAAFKAYFAMRRAAASAEDIPAARGSAVTK